jgi:hypothetical protein
MARHSMADVPQRQALLRLPFEQEDVASSERLGL